MESHDGEEGLRWLSAVGGPDSVQFQHAYSLFVGPLSCFRNDVFDGSADGLAWEKGKAGDFQVV